MQCVVMQASKEINNLIGTTLLVFNHQMKLLNVSCPLEVSLILDLGLGVDKDQRMTVCVKDHFFSQLIVPPIFPTMHKIPCHKCCS